MNLLLEHKILIRSPFKNPSPALFLDRDGVLIEDNHYVCRPENVSLCPGVGHFLSRAALSELPVVIVTNQSGISRGLFDWNAYVSVTKRMLELLGPAAPISAIYASGHGPEAASLSWRKPGPLMLLEASKDLNIDLGRSLIIGDRLTDLKAGAAAGLKFLAHVLTGYGHKERSSVLDWVAKEQASDLGSDNSLEVELLDSLSDFRFERLVCD